MDMKNFYAEGLARSFFRDWACLKGAVMLVFTIHLNSLGLCSDYWGGAGILGGARFWDESDFLDEINFLDDAGASREGLGPLSGADAGDEDSNHLLVEVLAAKELEIFYVEVT